MLLLVLLCGYVAIMWGQIGDQVPGHFGLNGEIQGMAERKKLLLMPVLGIMMYFGITIISLVPALSKLPFQEQVASKRDIYQAAKSLLIVMKCEAILLLFYLTVHMADVSALGPYFFRVTILIAILTLIFFVSRIVWFYLMRNMD